MNPPKKYGLLQLKSSGGNKGLVKKPSIFGNDSDEEDPQTAVKQMISRESTKTKLKRQTQMQIEDALTQDPTVYEYDSVYETLHPNEQKKKSEKPEDRKSKYIGGLLRAAEERKKELERRVERQVQREREAEGGIYGDKEEFVTDAYRRKMAERQEEEERERRQEQMEAMLDVRKQSNLSGFYRHLLNQTTGEEAIPEGSASSIALTKDEVQSASTAAEMKNEVEENKDHDLTSSDSDGDSDSDDARQSHLSPDGDSHHHRRDDKHRRHRQKHDDKDDTRKEPGGREKEGGHDRRETERGQSHKAHRHSRDSAERDDSRHHQKKRHNRNDDMSSSRHKASDASDTDKQMDSKHKQNSEKSETQKSVTTKFAKHNVGECVDDAKARYLARKRALKAAIVKEDD